MRFLQSERVRSANGGEPARQAQNLKQPHREPLELVGADRAGIAWPREDIERGLDTRKRPRAVGYVVRIIGEETFGQNDRCRPWSRLPT